MKRYIKSSTDTLPVVYFIDDISSNSLVDIFNEMMVNLDNNKVAVKISTGEPGGHNFLQPDLIQDLVNEVNGTIVECNTAYKGKRSDTESHLQVIEDHGFTSIADVDLLDEEDELEIPVENGKHLEYAVIGNHLMNYDYLISLAHFKGHLMAGFGGAIKNCAIGLSSPSGKNLIHSAGTSENDFGDNTKQNDFLESMAEAFSGITSYFGTKNICYINVMNNLSIDCDCDDNPAKPTMKDIGILASFDPIALDKACVDLVYDAPDGEDLIKRMEEKNGPYLLEYAEELNLGSQEYDFIELQSSK